MAVLGTGTGKTALDVLGVGTTMVSQAQDAGKDAPEGTARALKVRAGVEVARGNMRGEWSGLVGRDGIREAVGMVGSDGI